MRKLTEEEFDAMKDDLELVSTSISNKDQKEILKVLPDKSIIFNTENDISVNEFLEII